MRARVKVWLERVGVSPPIPGKRTRSDKACFGPGHVFILDAVARHGTLRKAAEEAGMSYRHAWDLLRESEECLGFPLVTSFSGGTGGGGMALTPECRAFLARWTNVCREVDAFTRDAVLRCLDENRTGTADEPG